MASVHINEDVCKGCGLCVNACPKKILKLSTDKLNMKGYHPSEITDKDKCILCAACAKMCPDCAIEIY